VTSRWHGVDERGNSDDGRKPLPRRAILVAMRSRRAFVLALLAARVTTVGAAAARNDASEPAREPIRFPDGFGAHSDSRIEWWYVTGALEAAARTWGFQITFFRTTTGVAMAASSRFAARELVFAHAAVSDLEQRRLRHDQRISRSGFGIAEAAVASTALKLRDWSLTRREVDGNSRYTARVSSDVGAFAFDLALAARQPILLQGQGGWSRKGPRPSQASRYYSEPQLEVAGTLTLDGRNVAVTGRAWLDHEWSDAFLDREAVGWDWIGMNLDDGAALTAFRMRRADGSVLWSGGSFRASGGAARDFADSEVQLTPRRIWTSPASGARYPVEWTIATPAGRFTVSSLLDDQELDSRASTGAIYWEGLSLLADANGKRVGRGYLEMTGYAQRLVL
jgi:predicted secreted hydrolase